MYLLETIRVENGIAENLYLHLERMKKSFQYLYKRELHFNLELIVSNLAKKYNKGLKKCRVVYNEKEISADITDYKIRNIKTVKLVESNTIDYSFKYENRNPIENLLVKRGSNDDIIIVKNGMITDSSYANLLFFDGKNWVTPSEPLLSGVQRQKLLDEKKIITRVITPGDLKYFRKVRFINAMIRFEDEIDLDINKILR